MQKTIDRGGKHQNPMHHIQHSLSITIDVQPGECLFGQLATDRLLFLLLLAALLLPDVQQESLLILGCLLGRLSGRLNLLSHLLLPGQLRQTHLQKQRQASGDPNWQTGVVENRYMVSRTLVSRHKVQTYEEKVVKNQVANTVEKGLNQHILYVVYGV